MAFWQAAPGGGGDVEAGIATPKQVGVDLKTCACKLIVKPEDCKLPGCWNGFSTGVSCSHGDTPELWRLLQDVLTPCCKRSSLRLKVFARLAEEGFQLSAARMPLSRERVPEAADLDTLRSLHTPPPAGLLVPAHMNICNEKLHSLRHWNLGLSDCRVQLQGPCILPAICKGSNHSNCALGHTSNRFRVLWSTGKCTVHLVSGPYDSACCLLHLKPCLAARRQANGAPGGVTHLHRQQRPLRGRLRRWVPALVCTSGCLSQATTIGTHLKVQAPSTRLQHWFSCTENQLDV